MIGEALIHGGDILFKNNHVDFRGVASRRQDEILIQICLFVFQTKNV